MNRMTLATAVLLLVGGTSAAPVAPVLPAAPTANSASAALQDCHKQDNTIPDPITVLEIGGQPAPQEELERFGRSGNSIRGFVETQIIGEALLLGWKSRGLPPRFTMVAHSTAGPFGTADLESPPVVSESIFRWRIVGEPPQGVDCRHAVQARAARTFVFVYNFGGRPTANQPEVEGKLTIGGSEDPLIARTVFTADGGDGAPRTFDVEYRIHGTAKKTRVLGDPPEFSLSGTVRRHIFIDGAPQTQFPELFRDFGEPNRNATVRLDLPFLDAHKFIRLTALTLTTDPGNTQLVSEASGNEANSTGIVDLKPRTLDLHDEEGGNPEF